MLVFVATIRIGAIGDDMAINYHDGGGNDPYTPDFTSIDVVPEDLAGFADLLDGDIAAINDTWARLKSEIGLPDDDHEESSSGDGRLLNPNFPGQARYSSDDPFAPELTSHEAGGILEGTQFGAAYGRTVLAELALMRDLIKGLKILRNAARDIHDGYVGVEAANADDVEDAFAGYEQWRVIEAFRDPDVWQDTDE
jgi:hypothetical protein